MASRLLLFPRWRLWLIAAVAHNELRMTPVTHPDRRSVDLDLDSAVGALATELAVHLLLLLLMMLRRRPLLLVMRAAAALDTFALVMVNALAMPWF